MDSNPFDRSLAFVVRWLSDITFCIGNKKPSAKSAAYKAGYRLPAFTVTLHHGCYLHKKSPLDGTQRAN